MKRNDLTIKFWKAAEKLMLRIPDWITGNTETMKYKYKRKYGDRDTQQKIIQNKVRTMVIYLCIASLLLITVLFGVAEQWRDKEEITGLSRPDSGKTAVSIPVEAHIRYHDLILTRAMSVKVNRKELTETEKLELLKNYKNHLGALILGDNKDYDQISKPLNLPDHDPETGIVINWTSSNPERINEKGEVNLIGADQNQSVELRADLKLDGLTAADNYVLRIDPEPSEQDLKRSILVNLRDRLEQAYRDDGSPILVLPDRLNEEIEVRWVKRNQSHTFLFVSILIICGLIVYFRRYDGIDREIKEAEESLVKDLPEFINKLVLLLNAGLVVSTAFRKIVNDYESMNHSRGGGTKITKKYLYEELTEMHRRLDRSNTSLIKELLEFSKRCGVREMVRLTAVISDNWNKGSMLAEKLEGESGLLWLSRKKRAEEKGRLAETKLTLPMVILLVVLIMITIAPAMMDM